MTLPALAYQILRHIRALIRFILLGLIVVFVVPLYGIAYCFNSQAATIAVTWRCCRLVNWVFGITLSLHNPPSFLSRPDKSTLPVLYVGNHLSYLDIPVLAAYVHAIFLAKSEVARWPIFGLTAKLQRTVFIDRNPSAAKKSIDQMSLRLQAKHNFILFPEGTSTDGRSVLPFKSSLFEIFLAKDIPAYTIQPLTLCLRYVDGQIPTTQELLDLYCWHRNMDTSLVVHLWRFAMGSGAQLDIIFHPALITKNYPDRKSLAKAAHESVSKGLENITQQP